MQKVNSVSPAQSVAMQPVGSQMMGSPTSVHPQPQPAFSAQRFLQLLPMCEITKLRYKCYIPSC